MKLKLGLPKGSLQEATFALFGRAGYSVKVSSRSYHPVIDDETIEPILLRPQEIPRYIEQGILDAGLTGKDWIEDAGADLRERVAPILSGHPDWEGGTDDRHDVCSLQYSKRTNNAIRVVVAVHNDSPIREVADLADRRVATEYVRLTEAFLRAKGVVPKSVEFSWGADEVKVPHLVDAIVVNTETGNSLRAHNLRIVGDPLLTSTPRLVANHAAWADAWKREKIENLAILLNGAMEAASLVGLKMNLPVARKAEILGILGSLKSPTISTLDDPGWIAAEVIMSEHEVRDLVPALKRAGATGLVEYPLNKVIY